MEFDVILLIRGGYMLGTLTTRDTLDDSTVLMSESFCQPCCEGQGAINNELLWEV